MPWLGALLFPAGAAVLLFACVQASPEHTLSAALLLLALGLSDDLCWHSRWAPAFWVCVKARKALRYC